MQRSADLTLRLLVGESLRLPQRLFAHHGDPGIDLRVPGLDGIEAGLGEVDGGKLLGANAVGGLLQRKRAEVGWGLAEGEPGG